MGQGRQENVATSLAGAVSEEISASLAPVDAELERRYPGDPGTRQPVHTVYVPGDVFAADTLRTWGDRALAALDEHAPDAASFAAVLGLGDDLAGPVYDRVRAKLEREPIEDLRVDFEDGYGPRPDAEEDEAAARAARLIAEAYAKGTAAPYMGIRMKCMEAPVRDRGIRTLDIFLTGLLEAGGLPDGLVLTLPKVTYAEQVTAMVRLLEAFEKARGLEPGRIGFEIQIETSQSILAADGTATVARMIERLRGPRHRPALRHLRLQRLPRRLRRPPGQRPPRRRPRQGDHAGRGGRHRRTRLGRLHQRPAGRPDREGPRRLATALRPHPARPRPRLLPGLGHAPRPHPHPLRGRLRLLPRGLRTGRRPSLPLRQPRRRRRDGRARDGQGPQRLSACGASTAAPSTSTRCPGRPVWPAPIWRASRRPAGRIRRSPPASRRAGRTADKQRSCDSRCRRSGAPRTTA